MSREIRRVPPNWQHPKDEDGYYIPMYDKSYQEAARAWLDEVITWDNGTHPTLIENPEYKDEYPFYWDYDGGPPNPGSYRPEFESEPTHYQIYEAVTEGTPVSPIFATLDDMKSWLISEGYSEYAASEFIKDGWCPSMIAIPGKGVSGIGIHSYDFLKED